ncbi:hypothetical protein ACN28E_03030 [Archangium lansingense]|uniref:hypothetical protein n=1 Tax=Archangium lansingense TaxID=2995310 RepID=UPI003B7CA41F
MNGNTKGQNPMASLELAVNAKAKFDELLRRQLGVADAKNPQLVVEALRKRYAETAARLDEEREGVPIRFAGQPAPKVVVAGSPSDSPGAISSKEVRTELEQDLKGLVEHPANRDYSSSLSGWRDAILAELDEANDATFRAADPAARDRAFYSMRKLGDFARVARMVSVLNPAVTAEFRRLAATLDEATMVLRVLAGESLFRAGFGEGGTVFQVALQDLRLRREALIRAVERFTSSEAEDDGNWGAAEASYGALLRKLGALGQHELRALLRPDVMTRLLDVLLDARAQYQSYYLRGIAASVPVELIQLRRLQKVAETLLPVSFKDQQTSGQSSTAQEQAASAPLSAFVQALSLFIESFAAPGTGARLLKLSLPSPLASLQLARADLGGGIAQELIRLRAQLAEELDSVYEDPDFDPLQWVIPLKLDRVLYDIDRSIDLYLMGGGNNLDGPEEGRAQLYGQVLDRWVALGGPDWGQEPDSVKQQQIKATLLSLVKAVRTQLLMPKQNIPSEVENSFLDEQRLLEEQWSELAVELTQVATGRKPLLLEARSLYVHPTKGTGARLSIPRLSRKELSELAERDRASLRSVPSVPPSTRISNLEMVRQLKEPEGITGELRGLREGLVGDVSIPGQLLSLILMEDEQRKALIEINKQLAELEGLVGTAERPGELRKVVSGQETQSKALEAIKEKLARLDELAGLVGNDGTPGALRKMVSGQEEQRKALEAIKAQLARCEADDSFVARQSKALDAIKEKLARLDELAGLVGSDGTPGALRKMVSGQETQRKELEAIKAQLVKMDADDSLTARQSRALEAIKEKLARLDELAGLVGSDGTPGALREMASTQEEQLQQLAAIKEQLARMEAEDSVQAQQRKALEAIKAQLARCEADDSFMARQSKALEAIKEKLARLDELAGLVGSDGTPGALRKMASGQETQGKTLEAIRKQLARLDELAGLVGSDGTPGVLRKMVSGQEDQSKALEAIKEQLARMEADDSIQAQQRKALEGIKEKLARMESDDSIQARQGKALEAIKDKLGRLDELAGLVGTAERPGALVDMASTQTEQRQQLEEIKAQLARFEQDGSPLVRQSKTLEAIREKLARLDELAGLVGSDGTPGALRKVVSGQETQSKTLEAIKAQLASLDKLATSQETLRQQLIAKDAQTPGELKKLVLLQEAISTQLAELKEALVELSGTDEAPGELKKMASTQAKMLEELENQHHHHFPFPLKGEERRSGGDRRKQQASFPGPERRSGKDRREH